MENTSLLAASVMPGSLAPAWAVVPVAIVCMLLLAGHVLAMARFDMPASRRRIRTVNGVLMLCTVPVLAYGFGLASPSDQRVFVMVWMLGAAMVLIVLGLACLDMANTWRIARDERRRILDEIRSGTRPALLDRRDVASPTANPPAGSGL